VGLKMKVRLKNLAEEKNWVVVKKSGEILHFKDFSDAVKVNEGNLMTQKFFEFYYSV
jgi:hypothetical protein